MIKNYINKKFLLLIIFSTSHIYAQENSSIENNISEHFSPLTCLMISQGLWIMHQNSNPLQSILEKGKINIIDNKCRSKKLMSIDIYLTQRMLDVITDTTNTPWILCSECNHKEKLDNIAASKQAMKMHLVFNHYLSILNVMIATTHKRPHSQKEFYEFLSCNTKEPSCCPIGECIFSTDNKIIAKNHLLEHIRLQYSYVSSQHTRNTSNKVGNKLYNTKTERLKKLRELQKKY